MSRVKVLLFGSVAALALLLAFGCSLLPREDTGTGDGWYIKLRIQAPAASKGITVSDFEVTGLKIQVRDPEGVVLQTIDWAADESSKTYLVPVKQLGVHEIEVTHLGERDGEEVEAKESATFNIQAMVITVIDIVPGCIGVIRIPEPIGGPSSWQLYGTWTNDDYNGMEGPLAKVVFHESGAVELYVNVWDSTPFGTGQFSITGDWTDEQAHWFRAIGQQTGEGIVYVLIRLYDGGNTFAEVVSDTGYPDPADLDPSSGKYDVIFYRQE